MKELISTNLTGVKFKLRVSFISTFGCYYVNEILLKFTEIVITSD